MEQVSCNCARPPCSRACARYVQLLCSRKGNNLAAAKPCVVVAAVNKADWRSWSNSGPIGTISRLPELACLPAADQQVARVQGGCSSSYFNGGFSMHLVCGWDDGVQGKFRRLYLIENINYANFGPKSLLIQLN